MISTLKKLAVSSGLCPTWIQTCVFAYENKLPTENEIAAYLNLLDVIKSRSISIKGVLLYGIARPSMQVDADKLSRLPEQWMQQFAKQIHEYDIEVRLTL